MTLKNFLSHKKNKQVEVCMIIREVKLETVKIAEKRFLIVKRSSTRSSN